MLRPIAQSGGVTVVFRFESKDRIGRTVAGFYLWGISSLGDFMVAMSDRGLVTLEFSSDHSAMEDALRVRFPEAVVIDSQEGLTDVLEKVNRAIEEPGLNPAVPLDLRGTPYEVEVWSMMRA